MKDDRVYLRHILQCIEAIGGYITSGRPQFFADRKTHKAVLRELQELSESVQRLSPELRAHHPEVPWAAIGGFRNVLVHDYLGISLSRVWDVIERDLPALRTTVLHMLRDLGERPPAP